MLFPSILKRLQSEVSQHVGDTSSGAVFVIWVDEASCTSLDVFYLVNVIFAGRGHRLQRSILKQSGQGRCRLFCCAQLGGQNRRSLRKKPRVELAFLVDSIYIFFFYNGSILRSGADSLRSHVILYE